MSIVSNLPDNAPDILAQVVQLMPLLDAEIARYVDPLTPQGVLELAQCWTLKRVLMTVASHTPDTEWVALAQLGRIREAAILAQLRPEREPRFAALLRIYHAAPRHKLDLLNLLYIEIEGLLNHKQPDRFRRALELFIEIELRAEHYEAALHLARHLDGIHFARMLRNIAEQAIEVGAVDTALEYIRLIPQRHYTHELTRISLTATMAAALADAGRTDEAEQYFIKAEGLLDDMREAMRLIQQQGETPILPDNLQYSSAVCDLALAYVRVGRLKDAARRFAEAYEPPPMLAQDGVFRRVCEKGFARIHDPIALMIFVQGLPTKLRQSVIVLEAARRLIQLGETAMAVRWLEEIEQHAALRVKALELIYSLGNDQLIDQKAAQEEQIINGLQRMERRTRLYHLAYRLATAGRVDRAAQLAAEIDYWDSFFKIHRLIVQHWAQHGDLERARDHVEYWLRAEPPQTTDVLDWQASRYALLHHSADFVQALDPALARCWLESAVQNLEILKRHPHYDLHCEELALTCLRLGAEDLTEKLVTTMTAPPGVVAELCYRVVEEMTKHGRYHAAQPYLQLAQNRRDILPNTHRTARDAARLRLAEYEERATPEMPVAPQQGVSRFAQYHKLDSRNRIAAFWREQDETLALHLFLGGLIESSAVFEEMQPGLYPRVVRACGAILARFSPEWTAL